MRIENVAITKIKTKMKKGKRRIMHRGKGRKRQILR